MRKALLIPMLSAFFFPAFSQQDSLLKHFKFRNSIYRAVNFNIGGASQFEKADLISGTNKNTNAAGGFGINYYTTKSTDRVLLTASAGLSSSFSAGKSSNSSSVNKGSGFSAGSNVSVLNKWFSKNKFIELGADAGAGIYTNKNDISTYPAIAKNNQGQYTITINTGVGTGRLENITDMQNALWLNKALEISNSLARVLNTAELDELGRTITKANNTRVLDSRKRTQFILATVDNYLQKQGLVAKTDINYFSNLNDILFFAFNTPRLSGTETFIRFSPSLSNNKNDTRQNNNIDKSQSRSDVKSLLLSTGFRRFVPHNLKHQNNYGASVKLSQTNADFVDRLYTSGIVTSEIKYKPDIKQAALDVFFEHAVYPNTRTIVNFKLQSQGGYQNINDKTDFFSTANLSGLLSYFISYRTRLNCSIGAAYQNNINQINNRYLEFLPNKINLYTSAGIDISL